MSSTDAGEDVLSTPQHVVDNSSQSVRALLPARPPSLPLAPTAVGLVTGVTGTCANAVVLVVLIFARC